MGNQKLKIIKLIFEKKYVNFETFNRNYFLEALKNANPPRYF